MWSGEPINLQLEEAHVLLPISFSATPAHRLFSCHRYQYTDAHVNALGFVNAVSACCRVLCMSLH